MPEEEEPRPPSVIDPFRGTELDPNLDEFSVWRLRREANQVTPPRYPRVHRLIEMGTPLMERIVPTIAGAAAGGAIGGPPGALAGGFLGGLTGSLGAQKSEAPLEPVSGREALAEGAWGAIPLGGGGMALKALKGALIGAGETTTRALAHERLPTAEELALGGGIGGVTGGAFGALEALARRGAAPTPTPRPPRVRPTRALERVGPRAMDVIEEPPLPPLRSGVEPQRARELPPYIIEGEIIPEPPPAGGPGPRPGPPGGAGPGGLSLQDRAFLRKQGYPESLIQELDRRAREQAATIPSAEPTTVPRPPVEPPPGAARPAAPPVGPTPPPTADVDALLRQLEGEGPAPAPTTLRELPPEFEELNRIINEPEHFRVPPEVPSARPRPLEAVEAELVDDTQFAVRPEMDITRQRPARPELPDIEVGTPPPNWGRPPTQGVTPPVAPPRDVTPPVTPSRAAAPPQRRVKIQRGMHGAVDVEFPDDRLKDLFSAVGRSRRGLRGEPGIPPEWDALAKRFGVDRVEVARMAQEYRDAVLQRTKGLAEGEVVQAPTLDEVLKARQAPVVELPRGEARPVTDLRGVPGERPVAPVGRVEPETGGPGRAQRGGPGEAPEEAPELLPTPSEDRAETLFRKLYDDARSQGFSGTEDDFRSIFDDRLGQARSLQDVMSEVEREHGPRELFKEVARLGGLRLDKTDPHYGELAQLWEESTKGMGVRRTKGGRTYIQRSPTADLEGVRGVLRQGSGMDLDDMADRLRQDPRFAHIEGPRDLLDELDQAIQRARQPHRMGGDVELEDALYASGVRPGEPWWEPRGPREPLEDFLDTGEVQSRLPGDVGAVRGAEIATPEFEAPFALEQQLAARPKAQQTSILEAAERAEAPAAAPTRARVEPTPRPTPQQDVSLEELSRYFEEIDQPERVRQMAERRGRALKQKRYPVGPAELKEESEKILARVPEEKVFETVSKGHRIRGGEFRTPKDAEGNPLTPREAGRNLRARGTNPRQMERRAQEMARLLEEPTPENLDRYARMLGDQADRFNETQLRGGTGKAGELPKRHETGEYLASGLGGFERLLRNNPTAFWRMLRTSGGGLVGALMTGEDSPLGDDPLLGAIYGGALGLAGPAVWRQLKSKAPTVYRTLRDTMAVAEGPAGVPPLRRPRGGGDIHALEFAMGLPERTVPRAWHRVRPLLDELAEAERAIPANASERYRRFVREMYLNEANAELRQLVKQAREANQPMAARYIEELRQELRGVPTWVGRGAQVATKGKVRARTIDRALGHATNHIYKVLLGWDSAVANMMQPILAYPYLGARSLARGYKGFTTQAGKAASAFLKLKRPTDAPNDLPAANKLLARWYDIWSRPLTATDSLNRRATYLGALDYARRRGIRDPKLRHEWAMDITGLTQGTPGDLGSNPFHRHFGPARAFIKFPTIFSQWAIDVARHPNPAVRRRGLALLGGAGALSVATGINFVNMLIPRLSLSLPVVKGAKDVYGHLTGESDHPLKADLPGAVVGRYPTKLAREAKDISRYGLEPHREFTWGGAPRGEHTPTEGLLGLAGIETTRQSLEREERNRAFRFIEDAVQQRTRRSREVRRSLVDAIESGDYQAVGEAVRQLTPAQRRDFFRRYRMTPFDLALEQVPVQRRREFRQKFGQFGRLPRENAGARE